MATFDFETLKFKEIEEGIRGIFLKFFYFDIPKDVLQDIGPYFVQDEKLVIEGPKSSTIIRKFERVMGNFIQTRLKSLIGDTKASYINKGPLIGSQRFGILDSDSNCLEIRPVSGCNLACTFCSVDEGPFSAKPNFYVDKDLLVDETKKLCTLKDQDMMIWIGAQGDPTLYYDLVGLVKGLKTISQVKHVAMVTNAVYLNEDAIDALADAGLDSLHISICAIDKDIAKKLAGVPGYNVDKVLKITEYAAKKMQVVVSPVYVPGENDLEMIALVKFAEEIGAKIAIQNFFEYKGGRRPVKGISMDEFTKKLEEWKVSKHDLGFEIKTAKVLQKPFKKGDLIEGEYYCDEYLCAQDRLIFVPKLAEKGKHRVKIIRDKHNIFIGQKA